MRVIFQDSVEDTSSSVKSQLSQVSSVKLQFSQVLVQSIDQSSHSSVKYYSSAKRVARCSNMSHTISIRTFFMIDTYFTF